MKGRFRALVADPRVAYVTVMVIGALGISFSSVLAQLAFTGKLPVAARIIVMVAATVAYSRVYMWVVKRQSRIGKLTVWPGGRAGLLIWLLAGLAAFVAGRRHAHLREAWAADQYDPESGELLPAWRRLRLSAGDVMAAFRCRLDDAVLLAWRPADALLASWHGSRLATLIPVTIAGWLIVMREGFYGLMANAENLAVIATAPYLAIKALRKYRQIGTPKRPEKKTSSAAGE